MHEIVLDTETTGLDPLNGRRIVEIGALELVDRSVFFTGSPEQSRLCRSQFWNDSGFHILDEPFAIDAD